MRTPRLGVVPSLLLLLATACASVEVAQVTPQLAPMPMGEIAITSAAVPAAVPLALTVPHRMEIEHAWTDSAGRSWCIAFRCTYATDDAHEALAAMCVRANWLDACEATRQTCVNANLDTFAGIAVCEERLQQQLSALLFPCATDAFLANVTGIEWTRWLVQ